MADLDEAIHFATYISELWSPGYSEHAVSRQHLAFLVGERIRWLVRGTDMDRLVVLGWVVENLRALANYFNDKWELQKTPGLLYCCLRAGLRTGMERYVLHRQG